MPIIQWSGKFSVGIQEIDHQHMQLIRLLNNLYDAMRQGEANTVLAPILKELVRYTESHFAYEEKLFRQFQYPETQKHIQQHQILAGQVKDFVEKLDTGKASITVELLNLLKDWLNHHILEEDKKYSSFLNANGVR